jgi:hypothetical protein
MRFAALFSLRLKHDYYPDSVCRDVSLEPTEETRSVLDGYRLRLRELADGASVWAQVGADGKSALAGLPQDELFAFDLRVANPDFAHFTDLEDFAGKHDPIYTNAGLASADGRTLKLVDGTHWSVQALAIPVTTAKGRLTLALKENPLAADGDAHKVPQPSDFSVEPAAAAKATAYDAAANTLTLQPAATKREVKASVRYRIKPARDRKILARVELHYDGSMPSPDKDDAPFEIRFKARAARWAYYLITDQKGEFSIVDAGAKPALGFSADNRTLLNKAPDDDDPVATALSRQYPDLQRMRFLSDQPVPCSSAARKSIELRLGGRKVLAPVPNPSVRHAAGIKRKAGAAAQRQNTFHQVVKFLKAR